MTDAMTASLPRTPAATPLLLPRAHICSRARTARPYSDRNGVVGACLGGNVQRTVRTSDGRTLAVEEGGDPAGRPVLVHMGTPNSRHLYGPHERDAAERGLRLIGYDRPGYGGSSPQPGRSVADC